MSEEKQKRSNSLKKEEFVSGVSKNIATLRTHKSELETALNLLSSASTADAAFPTLEQVRQLSDGMAVATKAAGELARLLKLRLQTRVKEMG